MSHDLHVESFVVVVLTVLTEIAVMIRQSDI